MAAALAWHVRGTYVVENFDEIFMLKLKTLSTSTAGMKKKYYTLLFTFPLARASCRRLGAQSIVIIYVPVPSNNHFYRLVTGIDSPIKRKKSQ